MYKLRLNKWGFKKNFKLPELAAAADAIRPFYRAGLNPPKMRVDNRELPAKRVRRHLAEVIQRSGPLLESSRKHRHIQKGHNLRTGPSKMHVQKIVPEVPKVTLKLSLGMGLFEKTLIQVNHYFTWRSSKEDNYFLMRNQQTTRSFAITDPCELRFLIGELTDAMTSRAYHLITDLLRAALNLAPKVISEQHPDLLSKLITICSRRSSDPIVERMMSAILSYLTSMARKLLSESHPVSMLLQLRLQRFKMEISFQPIMRLIYDIDLRQYGHCWKPCLSSEVDMISVVWDYEGPFAASRFGHDSLLHYQEILGPEHWCCSWLTAALAKILYHNGLNTAAEKTCRELLDAQSSPNSLDFQSQELTRLLVMDLLGDITAERDNYAEAASCYRQAYDVYKECWGTEDTNTLSVLHKAQRMVNQSAGDGSEADTEEPETSEEHLVEQLIMELGEDITRLDLVDAGNASAPAKQPWEPNSLAFEDPQASRRAGEADSISLLDIPRTNGEVEFDEQGVVRNDLTGFEASPWPSSSHNVGETQDADLQTMNRNDMSANYAEGTSYLPLFFDRCASEMQASTLCDIQTNTTFATEVNLSSFSEQSMPITPTTAMADYAQKSLNNNINALPQLNTEVDLGMLDYAPLTNAQSDFNPRIHEVDMDFNVDDLINWDDDMDFQDQLQ